MDPAGSARRASTCALRTSTRGVFAAGNLLHGAETADVAALSGRHAARAVDAFLRTGDWPERGVALQCEPPLRWVSPSASSATGGAPAARPFHPARRRDLRRGRARGSAKGNASSRANTIAS